MFNVIFFAARASEVVDVDLTIPCAHRERTALNIVFIHIAYKLIVFTAPTRLLFTRCT